MKNHWTLVLLVFIGSCYPGFSANAYAADPSVEGTTKVTSLLEEALSKILKPGEDVVDLDSAILLATTAESLSKDISFEQGLADAYTTLAMAHREKGERDKGKTYAVKAVDYCKVRQIPESHGKALVELSQYYDPYEALAERMQYIRQAAEAYRLSGNIKEQAFCLKNLGDCLTLTDSLGQSIFVLKQSVALYESINDQGYRGAYDLLGTMYREVGDYDLALKYGLQAEKAAEIAQDTTQQLCTILNRIGITYQYSKDYDQAARYFEKSFAIASRYDDTRTLYNVHANLMNAYLAKGRGSEALKRTNEFVSKYPPNDDVAVQIFFNRTYLNIYRVLNNKTEGQKYCDKVLSLSNDNTVVYNMITYHNVIDFLLKTRQYDRAESALKTYDLIIEDTPFLKYKARNTFQWFKLDSARGNHLSAIGYHQRYKELEDSLYSLNKAQQVEALKLEFETEKKDKNIQLLTQRGELQQARLDQSQLTRNITFVGTGLLLLIAGLLYYLYELKQKSNKDLTHLLGEKEWLLKEIHHRVKNNLQTVLSLLESQSRKLKGEASHALHESQNRVYAMSLIHKKLYQSSDVSTINMDDYLRDLVQHLRDSFGSSTPLRFTLGFEFIELDVSQAVPIGLIVNEAITNAIKYAFHGKSTGGEINVSLTRQPGNKIRLLVADNGGGIANSSGNTEGLGLKLMRGLTDDIEGEFTIESRGGVVITVEFTPTVPFQKISESNVLQPVLQPQ